jgi:hypothetical protein
MTERPHDDFVTALREAEAQLLEERPARPDHQRALLGAVLERERSRPARRLRAWLVGGAGTLALAAASAALAWPYLTTPPTPTDATPPAPVAENATPAPTPSPLAALGLTSDTCDADASDDGVSFASGCDASWAALRSTVTVDAPSTLARLEGGDGLAVRRGQVTFDIDPARPAARVVRVAVSGGVIEVLGTRFTVVEEGDRGEVTLHRGSIRFVPEQGAPRTLSPGDSHRWGEARASLDATDGAPAEAPPEATPRPPRRPKVVAKTHRDTLAPQDLSRLRELRRLGRHDDALAHLKRLSRKDLDPTTLEILNYERGEILGLQGKTEAACAHWTRHLRAYPKGAYRREVRAHSERLGCRK